METANEIIRRIVASNNEAASVDENDWIWELQQHLSTLRDAKLLKDGRLARAARLSIKNLASEAQIKLLLDD